MKPGRKWQFAGGIALIFVLISGGYALFIARRATGQYRRILDPSLKPIATRRVSRQLPAATLAGVRTFPFAAGVRDALPAAGRFLLAGDAGLASLSNAGAEAFHRANGLPASALLRLTALGDAVAGLAPEGLLVVRADWSSPSLRPAVDRYAPADGARLVDLAESGGQIWVLDEKGRILQFAGDRFWLYAQTPPAPAACLATLGGRPAVGALRGDLWLIEGKGEAARRQSLWPSAANQGLILALVADEPALLVGVPDGLWRVDRLGATQLLAGSAVSAAARWDTDVWVGGPDGQLRNLAGDRRWPLGAPIHRLRAAGATLLAATDDGLWLLDGAGPPRRAAGAEALKPLAEPYVTALAALPNGDVLAGGLNHGLQRLTPDRPPAAPAALANLGVNRIVADGDRVWVATTNGLFQLDGALSVRKRWTDRDGLPHRYVASVLADGDGATVATSAGLAQLAPGRVRAIDAFHGLAGNHLYCLTRWGRNLAVGGLAGLSLVGGPDGLTPLRNLAAPQDGLPHNWVNALLADGDRLLIGTYGGGLAVVEGDGPARPLAGTAGISVNPEAALHYGGYYLFGTLTRGVAVSRDGRRWVFLEQPLLSPNVTALAGAPDGLWLGFDRGLMRLPWETVSQALE
jgi:ligand-binding sensor domain-containing protein